MYADNIAALYYPLGYETCKQASNIHVRVLFKDEPDCNKVILLLNNYGKNRAQGTKNLKKIIAKVKMNLFFSSRENIQVLCIIFHHWKKDKIALKSMENVIDFNDTGSLSSTFYNPLFEVEVKTLQEYKKEQSLHRHFFDLNSIRTPYGVPFVSFSLLFGCLLGFLLEADPTIYGLSIKNVIGGERILCAASYMFLHANFFHLLGNMTCLISFGVLLERRIGHTKFLLLTMLGGIYAGLFDVTLHLFQDTSTITIGFSGAGFAILGGFFIYQLKSRKHVGQLLLYIIFSLGLGTFTPWVNDSIHLIGFLCGLYFMLIDNLILTIRKKMVESKISYSTATKKERKR